MTSILSSGLCLRVGGFSLSPDSLLCSSEGRSFCTHLGGKAEDKSPQEDEGLRELQAVALEL